MDWQIQWWKRNQCKFSDNQVCDTLNLGILHFAPISIIQILSCFCMCQLRSHLNPTFLATHWKCLNLRGCFLKWDILVNWISIFMKTCFGLSIQYDFCTDKTINYLEIDRFSWILYQKYKSWLYTYLLFIDEHDLLVFLMKTCNIEKHQ